MAETLKTIASSTAKLRELLVESKKDLHSIQQLLDALDHGLRSLWPFQDLAAPSKTKYVAPELVSDPSLWKETVTLISSSRIVSTTAQAEDALAGAGAGNENANQRAWFGDGKQYSRWVGRGAVWMVSSYNHLPSGEPDQSIDRVASPLIGKGMSIGYRDDMVEEVTRLMVIDKIKSIDKFVGLITALKSWEQRYFLASLLLFLARLLSQSNSGQETTAKGSNKGNSYLKEQDDAISATASFLRSLADALPSFQSQLVETLTASPQSIPLTRAILAMLPASDRAEVLRTTWSQFSDTLHIRNVPVMSQEANARVLLMSAGYVSRGDQSRVQDLGRSSMHGNAISERLNSSTERIRWLGMCVGMAVSSLVDNNENKLEFGVEDMQTTEANTLRALVNVDDKLGDVNELQWLFGSDQNLAKTNVLSSTPLSFANKSSKPAPLSQSKTKIIEILDVSDEEEDHDLKPYAKPDSDEPDSEEDATLVSRDKPKAPVYIRDLISALSDTENEARYTLSLRTAAPLIRRKATFGKELYDRISELGQCLVSLQNHFETEDFHDLKQEGLVALIVADPKTVGPWMIKSLFESDLSISQRVSIVVALGVGGRELAGYKTVGNMDQVRSINNGRRHTEDTAASQEQQGMWPSKMLPGKLHDLYSNSSNIRSLVASNGNVRYALQGQEKALQIQSQNIEGITRQMETTMLDPVATREWSKPRPRTRMLKNDLTTTVADSFFFPLTRYWQIYSQSSARQTRNPLDEPILMALTLKTLTLLLLAAGPSAPSLPQTTKELFALILSLRNKALNHQPVLEAILFALVAILDLHGVGIEGGPATGASSRIGARWLAEDCGKEVVETREWVGGIWERIEKAGSVKLNIGNRSTSETQGGDEDTERCRVLAAKVLVGISEIVEGYQRLLVSELSRV